MQCLCGNYKITSHLQAEKLQIGTPLGWRNYQKAVFLRGDAVQSQGWILDFDLKEDYEDFGK